MTGKKPQETKERRAEGMKGVEVRRYKKEEAKRGKRAREEED